MGNKPIIILHTQDVSIKARLKARPDLPQTSKRVNRAPKTRTIWWSRRLNMNPKRYSRWIRSSYSEWMALETGQWRNKPFARILRKYMKRQAFLTIGNISKGRSAAFMRTIFCSCRVRFCLFVQFNCDVALRRRFHAYDVVSTCALYLLLLKTK